jgi:hypothetical protein
VAYWDGTTSQAGSNNLFWDNANGRLGIGTNTPAYQLDVNGSSYFDTTSKSTSNNIIIKSGNLNEVGLQFSQTSGLKWQLYSDAYTANNFYLYNNKTSSFAFRIVGSNNNFLLGTTTDSGQRLQVQGTTLLNGDVTFSSATGMFWDATNSRLGIGTNAPSAKFQVNNSVVGDSLRVNGASNTSLVFNTDSDGRATINVYGNTSATSNGGAYFNAYGYQESWFLVAANQASAGNKNWRFGNLGSSNYFAIQKLNDALNAISSTPFVIHSTSSNVSIGSAFTTDSGERLQVTGTAVVKDITTSSVASALFQLSSTTKGFLPPRMTTTQKNAISSPAAGLVVYDTTLAKLCVYTTAWETITSI